VVCRVDTDRIGFAGRASFCRQWHAAIQARGDTRRIFSTGHDDLRSYADPAFPDPLAALDLFDFDTLRRIGFDHMRVPLDVGPLMQADDATQQKILGQLVAVVSAINRHGLNVLVTLFPPSLQHELPQTYLDGLDGPRFTAYAAVVDRVSTALSSIDPGAVALEPMNEPQSQCRVYFATDWIAYQQAMVARIRRISARLPLFLTGGCWWNIEGIVTLDTDLLPIAVCFVASKLSASVCSLALALAYSVRAAMAERSTSSAIMRRSRSACA
jgi:hypothetical protein